MPVSYPQSFPSVTPRASGDLLCEAEEFQRSDEGWSVKDWGENYYAATFANTFMSRKKYLSAPSETGESWVYREVEVPRAGEYLVLVRYEAPDRFSTCFTVNIEQAGREVFTRPYGRIESKRIWPFQGKEKRAPKARWRPSWGTGEQMAWEGADARVILKEGKATVGLRADSQEGLIADRNVDLVLLTPNAEDVAERLEKERYLPLDGLLTQEGDLELTVVNLGDQPLKVTIPPAREHSPYWVHLRQWQKIEATLPPGELSSFSVGQLMDSLNDGDWHLSFSPGAEYRLSFTTPRGPSLEFSSNQESLVLAYDADTRYSGRIRLQSEVIKELADGLEADGTSYRFPELFPVYGRLPDERAEDVPYSRALQKLREIFPLRGRPSPLTVQDGYVDIRSKRGQEELERFLAEVRKERGEDAVEFACFGDEIALPGPPAGAPGFQDWLNQQEPGLGNFAWDYNPSKTIAISNPAQFYFSNRYKNEFGLRSLAERTALVKRFFPSAETGANFSPHRGAFYLGTTIQWIELFRRGAMTVPWSEDYIWQVPVGSQQMSFLTLDLARAANRLSGHSRIIRYVMAHSPGNIPQSWRRQFFGSLGHGMTELDLFEFRPVQTSYSENSVSSLAMYQEVRRSLDQLAKVEDLLESAQVKPGRVAMWCSETGDIWSDSSPPLGPARRALYIMLRHLQHTVEFVTPEDNLQDVDVLMITDLHVSRADAQKIHSWVEGGGQLVLTAGAGTLDETNSPHVELLELAGLQAKESQLSVDASIRFIKQDLSFAQVLGHLESGVPCFGLAAELLPQERAKVLETFKNGRPAAVRTAAGEGSVTTLAYLPGLSYFHPAIPKRPMDRGNTPEAMSHFIPEDFDWRVLDSLRDKLPDVKRPVWCEDPLVACHLLVGAKGLVVPIVRWRAESGQVTVHLDQVYAGGGVTLVSGKPVESLGQGMFSFDLEVADALVIRK